MLNIWSKYDSGTWKIASPVQKGKWLWILKLARYTIVETIENVWKNRTKFADFRVVYPLVGLTLRTCFKCVGPPNHSLHVCCVCKKVRLILICLLIAQLYGGCGGVCLVSLLSFYMDFFQQFCFFLGGGGVRVEEGRIGGIYGVSRIWGLLSERSMNVAWCVGPTCNKVFPTIVIVCLRLLSGFGRHRLIVPTAWAISSLVHTVAQ